MAEEPGDRRRRRAGEDREHQLAVAQARPQVSRHAPEHLRLDREQDDVRAVGRFLVARDDTDPVLARELLAPLGPRMARDDLVGLDEAAAQQPGDHRLRHHAGADGRDPALGEGRHGREDSGGSPATADPSTKNRGVAWTSARSKPAASRAARSSSGS